MANGKIANWKTGSSACFYGKLDPDITRRYAEGGVGCLELSFSRDYYYGELDFKANPARVAGWAADAGIKLWSIHLPFSRVLDISHPDREMREHTMLTNAELIEAAEKAGIPVAVVHPSSEPILNSERSERFKRSEENLEALAIFAAEHNIKLAVEDLPRTCLCNNSAEMRKMLDAIPELYVAFDTNHLLGDENANADFIKTVGERIITLHVSDYDFIDERHQMPLCGKNDWKAVIAALEAADYSGPWLYEIGSGGKYTPADLKANHILLSNI